MRKSKKVVFYSMLVCFAFLIAVVVALANAKPKVEEEPVYYTVAVNGPSRIEFEYVPDVNAGASLYKVYEYAFGNEMDETLRVMLAKDNDAQQENVNIGYYVSAQQTIINQGFKFSGTLSAVDIPSGEQRWVYMKITAQNADELAIFTKDITWVAGKPVDSYVKVNGQTTNLPSINTGSSNNTTIDYGQALKTPALEEGEVFGGWYADPFCGEPLNLEDVRPNTEIYANIYVPSTVTEDDWNAPEVAQSEDGSYKEVLSTNGSTASMYDLGSDGCFYDYNTWQTTETDLYVPAYYKGLPVTDVKLEGLGLYDYVYIPPTVSSLFLSSTFAMSGRNVEIDPENPYYVVIDGKFIVERATKKLINHIGTDTSTVVPDHIEIIGSGAFAYEDTSRYITLPDSIIKIEEDAFIEWYLSGTSYGGAWYIGSKTNPYMVMMGIQESRLTSLPIHSKTKFIYCSSISYNWDCESLTSITIPSSVIGIVGTVFTSCKSLSRIVVESGNTVYDSRNNCNAIIETATNTLIRGCKSTIIPNTVTGIGNDAFYGCSSLTGITIPSSVISIGNRAFSSCSSLTSITIPSSVISIGNMAFSSCSSLTSVDFAPNSQLTSIEHNTFNSCYSLTSITIPSSVISIGNSAFRSCYALVEVYNLSGLSINIGSNSNGYIGYYAKVIHKSLSAESRIQTLNNMQYYVYGSDFIAVSPTSRNITSITLDDRTTEINQYTFYDCRSLISITISSGVTSIGDYTFYYCKSLTTIIIPDSVTRIGKMVFYDCSKLTSITFSDTSTWYRTDNATNWANKTGGTQTTVTTPSTNDDYFKSRYQNYYWYKI